MRKLRKYMIGLIICVLLFSQYIYGESTDRPIYIGDIIELEMDDTYYTNDEIMEAFSAFEIVSLEKIGDQYRLKIRQFEPGAYEVILGTDIINISVASTLDTMDQEGIIASDFKLEEAGWITPWYIIIVGLASLFILAIFMMIKTSIRHKKQTNLTPKALIYHIIKTLDVEQEDYIQHLSFAYKDYLYNQMGYLVQGLTTKEIMIELKAKQIPEVFIKANRQWFMSCDHYKYTKEIADISQKTTLKNQLITLVDRVDEEKEVLS